jgi:hypothetical protein
MSTDHQRYAYLCLRGIKLAITDIDDSAFKSLRMYRFASGHLSRYERSFPRTSISRTRGHAGDVSGEQSK